MSSKLLLKDKLTVIIFGCRERRLTKTVNLSWIESTFASQVSVFAHLADGSEKREELADKMTRENEITARLQFVTFNGLRHPRQKHPAPEAWFVVDSVGLRFQKNQHERSSEQSPKKQRD